MAFLFNRTKIGGGGYVVDLDFSPDGLTRLHRTDVHGAYIWDSVNDKWKNLLNATSLTGITSVLGNINNAFGSFALRVAPSNSAIIYMVTPSVSGEEARTTVFKSTDRGVTFAPTNLTPMEMTMQSNYRAYGPKMAVHPTNPDIVLVSNTTGEWYRTANGGTSWSPITTPDPGEGAVVFDPSDGNKVYIGWVLGTSRVYRSTDAGATFSQLTGGPDTVGRIKCSVDGTVYITTAAGVAWKLSGTTFTDLTSAINQDLSGWHGIACDPTQVGRVSLMSVGGGITTTLDAGATWSGAYDNAPIRESSDDVPWLEWTLENYMSNGDCTYDPIVAGKLWIAEGIGVWYGTPPTDASRPTWYSQTRGNDELIVNKMIYPPGGYPILSMQDRGLFTITAPNTYPSTHGPGPGIAPGQLQHFWGMDYASSDPDFVCALGSGGFGSCYSTDKGLTWTPFASQDCGTSGAIAALTPLNMVVLPGNDGAPKYTTDGGATWLTCTFSDSITPGYGYAPILNLGYVAADRVASNFYVVNYNAPKAMYKSTDGGANFTKITEGVVEDIGQSAQLLSVPGQSGHIFFTTGTLAGSHPSTIKLKRSTNAGTTWTTVDAVAEAWCMGFGKEPPGGSYPTIMVAGFVNGDTDPGIYISIDNCVTWNLASTAPDNSIDLPRAIAGDMNTYLKFFIGLSSSGSVYTEGQPVGGVYNFQLGA